MTRVKAALPLLVFYSEPSYLVESFNDEIKVGCDFVELVSSKEVIDVLHLLYVWEEVPVVDG